MNGHQLRQQFAINVRKVPVPTYVPVRKMEDISFGMQRQLWAVIQVNGNRFVMELQCVSA